MSNDDADVLAAAFSEYLETEAKNKAVCLEAITKALDEQYRANLVAYERLYVQVMPFEFGDNDNNPLLEKWKEVWRLSRTG